MYKKQPYTFFLILFLCPAVSFSQDEVTVTDTVIQTQTTASNNDTTSFRTIVTIGPITTRSVPSSRLDSFRKADEFWYANTAPERKKDIQETPRRNRTLMDKEWFRNLMWIIVLSSFIAVVVWYLYSSKILLFRRTAKKIGRDAEDESIEDIFALNYEKEIAKAVYAGDFRLATRLWYLRTLKHLSDKGLIDYQFGRTNSDYVLQLRSTAYYREFARLTRAFEYTWYGQFALPSEVFANMQSDFSNFKKALGG